MSQQYFAAKIPAVYSTDNCEVLNNTILYNFIMIVTKGYRIVLPFTCKAIVVATCTGVVDLSVIHA